ncbi:MAG: hypothetical protein ACWGOX_09675 [Desulforhopalus sp.]
MKSSALPKNRICNTPEQKKYLYMKWCRYEPFKQQAILVEYLEKGGDFDCKDDFLNYLKARLEAEGQLS